MDTIGRSQGLEEEELLIVKLEVELDVQSKSDARLTSFDAYAAAVAAASSALRQSFEHPFDDWINLKTKDIRCSSIMKELQCSVCGEAVNLRDARVQRSGWVCVECYEAVEAAHR